MGGRALEALERALRCGRKEPGRLCRLYLPAVLLSPGTGKFMLLASTFRARPSSERPYTRRRARREPYGLSLFWPNSSEGGAGFGGEVGGGSAPAFPRPRRKLPLESQPLTQNFLRNTASSLRPSPFGAHIPYRLAVCEQPGAIWVRLKAGYWRLCAAGHSELAKALTP